MTSVELDMIQSAGVGALALLVGMGLTLLCWHSLPASVSKAT